MFQVAHKGPSVVGCGVTLVLFYIGDYEFIVKLQSLCGLYHYDSCRAIDTQLKL